MSPEFELTPDRHERPTLIFGNGLRISVSPKFRYAELLSSALVKAQVRSGYVRVVAVR
jgi:hypothetical protein